MRGLLTTPAETGTMATDVLNNNNISQRNISVVNNNTMDIAPPRGHLVNILVPNTNTATIKTKFTITSYSNSTGNSMVSVGNPYIKLNEDLYSLWVSGGSVGSNVSDCFRYTVYIYCPTCQYRYRFQCGYRTT
jgi:hypothetical protein